MFRLVLLWRFIAILDFFVYKRANKHKDIHVMKDIPYTSHVFDRAHKMDIALPNQKGPHKVIINIHGGAWVYGNKDRVYGLYGKALAKEGYAVVTLNYRLAPKASLRDQIQDIFACINTLQDSARFPDLDMDTLFLVGDSAGAHLAALTSILLSNNGLQEDFVVKANQKITGLGLNCGVYNLKGFTDKTVKFVLRHAHMRALFHQRDYGNHPLFLKSSIPNIINDNFPPTYIMGTEFDPLYSETVNLINHFNRLKIPYKAELFNRKEKLPHVFHLKYSAGKGEIVRTNMTEFFKSLD